jgi:hypothetical protein
MALSFTTGMTQISNADSTTNWTTYKITSGGTSPALVQSTDILKQGSACNCFKPTASKDQGLIYDYYTANGNTTLNLSTAGNEVVGFWLLVTSPATLAAISSGGGYLIACSSNAVPSTSNNWSQWWVTGASIFPGGWVFFLVDTRKTPSATGVAACTLSSVYRIGVGTVASATVPRAESFFVDAMWYGRPIYTVIGDGSTTATWNDILTDSETTNVNGLFQNINGAIQASCGIQFGSASQSSTTTFADTTGQAINFKRYTYYQGGTIDALNYTDYYTIKAYGKSDGTQKTSITLGSVVGSGDAKQGVMGGRFRSLDTTNVPVSLDFQTDKANLSACNLYGVTFSGITGGLLFDNNSGGTETNLVSCQYINCGLLDPGSTGNGANILNCFLINPLGGTSANRGLRLNSAHNVKKLSCITSGSPSTQHMLYLPSSGTYSITFNGIIFYGDYSSSSLWHGELPTNNASATLALTAGSGSNPDTAEFDKTGTGITIGTATSVTLTIVVKNENGNPIQNALAYIDNNDQTPFIMNKLTDGDGIATESYTGSSVSNSRWRVRLYGYKQVKQLIDIGSDNITLPVTLVIDPQQT